MKEITDSEKKEAAKVIDNLLGGFGFLPADVESVANIQWVKDLNALADVIHPRLLSNIYRIAEAAFMTGYHSGMITQNLKSHLFDNPMTTEEMEQWNAEKYGKARARITLDMPGLDERLLGTFRMIKYLRNSAEAYTGKVKELKLVP